MKTPRISSSSYSNTAPLIWSFLYGSEHGKVEIILDNAPARSAQLLSEGRVDAALVPVIAYHFIDGVRLVPNVCVGAKQRVKSVCLVSKCELDRVGSVVLDVSSRTSVALTKIIFREFVGTEPVWSDAAPDLDEMLAHADAAVLIGDPALMLPDEYTLANGVVARKYDLAALWRHYTGLGFIFAMWMTRLADHPVDFGAARDEGVVHIDDIIGNYDSQITLSREEMRRYLSDSISYTPDESMIEGMKLYFELARKHGLLENYRKLTYV